MNMPRLVYAIPCLQVIHDSETNLMNYINCIEQLNVPHFPFEFGELIVGTSWVRLNPGDEIKLNVRLRVEGPDGQVMAERELQPQVPETYERFRYNIRLPLFEVREGGDHFIHVETHTDSEWISHAVLPVRVTAIPADEVVEPMDEMPA